ncbi:MAG: AMP-binding protein [Gemmatimonadetes bacterium]|nr:AMP-binding protein [Gemmatimonadota bacterium]
MILYLDSLFVEDRDRAVRPLHVIPDTLSQLYQMAMREHRRKAVLLHRVGDRWAPTPDWRFDRQVIRLGLYLREHAGIEPGDRVAIVSEFRPEYPVVDFAAAALGAATLSLPPALGIEPLAEGLRDLAPRALFVSGAVLERAIAARERAATSVLVVAFDGFSSTDDVLSYSSILDLGGTLDTPERAQSFRAGAREIGPDQLAVLQYELTREGTWTCEHLTQGDVIAALRERWRGRPAHEGDVAYVVGPEPSLASRLAVYGFIGEGYTTVALGTPGEERAELAELRPHVIVAPPASLERLVGEAGQDTAAGVSRVLQRWLGPRREERALRRILGGRLRWLAPTGTLDPDAMLRLAAVEIGTTPVSPVR